MDDLRQSLQQFYEFLKSFDYLEATTRIKSNLYDQAVNLIQRGEGQAQVEPAAPQDGQQAQEQQMVQ